MKKQYILILVLIVVVIISSAAVLIYKKHLNNNQASISNIQTNSSRPSSNNNTNSQTIPASQPQTTDALASPNPNLDYPIAQFSSRFTKKPFGIYITPATSPVQPERFTGYHTGTDIEYTDTTTDVPVYAIENATVRYVGTVSGYGGVIILEAPVNGQTDTILYGHLRISSAKVKVGDTVSKGQQLAVLGTGYSSETDGERRHLHFSIHKGSSIVYLGYVQQKAQLSDWIDAKSIY